MKRIYLAMLAIAVAVLAAAAIDFNDETINYKVMYKWGLINKQAGSVSIALRNMPDGTHYHSQLTARSAGWADRFYKVRDTLTCEIVKRGLIPTYYEKRAHEGSDNNYDRVDYKRSGNSVTAETIHRVVRDGEVKRDMRIQLEAEGYTVDMLTAYYYMRTLPFGEWKPGHSDSINIFSGKRKELLTIHYHGTERVEYDGRSYDCYKITFVFTSDGKKKSSDNMYAWITTGPERIPVKLEGKLPVGSIKCFYEP